MQKTKQDVSIQAKFRRMDIGQIYPYFRIFFLVLPSKESGGAEIARNGKLKTLGIEFAKHSGLFKFISVGKWNEDTRIQSMCH